MRQKNFTILIGCLIFLHGLLGCSVIQKVPVEKIYFDLNIDVEASNQDNISKGEAILIKEFSINSAFESHSFVYRVGKNEYINDYFSEFVSYPAKLITEKIQETLCISSYFKPALTNIKQEINYRLSGKITRLYGDFQEANHPKAIIEIRMVLEKKMDNAYQAISSKTYTAEEQILSRRPDQLVSGWNTGLSKIITAFINEFQAPASSS